MTQSPMAKVCPFRSHNVNAADIDKHQAIDEADTDHDSDIISTNAASQDTDAAPAPKQLQELLVENTFDKLLDVDAPVPLAFNLEFSRPPGSPTEYFEKYIVRNANSTHTQPHHSPILTKSRSNPEVFRLNQLSYATYHITNKLKISDMCQNTDSDPPQKINSTSPTINRQLRTRFNKHKLKINLNSLKLHKTTANHVP